MDEGATGPRKLTDSQEWVRAVCAAFGWSEKLKAGHAATLAKRLREKCGATWQEFERHYGRVDPGAGEWWVYREVFQCKAHGEYPTPSIVSNTWGRWELPVMMTLPAASSGAAALVNYARELRHGNSAGSD